MIHKIRFLLPLLFLITVTGTLVFLTVFKQHRPDERYLLIRPLDTLQLKEDFSPYTLPLDINSSHPGQTSLSLTVSDSAPFQAGLQMNPQRILLTPINERFGQGQVTIQAVLENITTRRHFTVIVSSRNDPPRATSTLFTTPEDTVLTATLQARDPDGDPLVFTIPTPPAQGLLQSTKKGRFTYTPPSDFNGVTTFSYQVADPTTTSYPQTVTIRVTPRNDAPKAFAKQLSTAEEQPLTEHFAMQDIDSSKLTAKIVSHPRHGRLELLPRQQFRYTPAKDFFGTDTFRFQADDGRALSKPRTVTITVTNINDRPRAFESHLKCREDTVCNGRLKAFDSDDTRLTFILKNAPKKGTVALRKSGRFTYHPKNNFFGKDAFTFTVSDGRLASTQATVKVTVASNRDDARATMGRLAGSRVALYDYDKLGSTSPTPFYTTQTTRGNTLDETGLISLPLERLAPDGMYILSIQGGENLDSDSNGKIDSTPAHNRGTLHLLATGASLIKENVSVNIIGELIYQRLATRLKAGYDKPYLIATLDELTNEYIERDIDGDGDVSYSDVLRFDYRKHTDYLKQPWDDFLDAIDELQANTSRSNGLKSRCKENPSEDLIYDVALNGPYAFIANGSRGLTVVNKEDLHAAPLGRLDTPGYTRAIESGGKLVYLADGSSGVRIVDISDINDLKTVSVIDTFWYALDLALKYPYLYVSDGSSGVIVIGVRDPERPEKTAVLDTPGYAFGLAVRGDYAYIADGPTGVLIVDISDPGAPRILTTYDTQGYAFDVTVQENYAFIADGSAGIIILDISNATRPKPVSTIDSEATTFAVETDGKFLYTAEYEGGVRVWDISNPKAPFKTASYTELCGVFNLKIIGQNIYACDDFSGLVRLKKVRNIIP